MIPPMDTQELATWAIRMLSGSFKTSNGETARMRDLELHQQIEVLEVALALVRVQLQRPVLDLQRREVIMKFAALRPELLAAPIRDEVA